MYVRNDGCMFTFFSSVYYNRFFLRLQLVFLYYLQSYVFKLLVRTMLKFMSASLLLCLSHRIRNRYRPMDANVIYAFAFFSLAIPKHFLQLVYLSYLHSYIFMLLVRRMLKLSLCGSQSDLRQYKLNNKETVIKTNNEIKLY